MAHRSTSLDRRGFTLVELVLVMLIIGVIGAIAMPRFAQASSRQQLAAAAQRVENDLDRAQHHARAASSRVAVRFVVAEDRYTVTPIFAEAWQVQLNKPPYQTSLSKVSFNGNSTVVFNGFGVPSSPGTIVLSSSAGSVTLTMDAGGRVSQ